MAITDYQTARHGTSVTVTVTSDLGTSPTYYHWWLDGVYCGRTVAPINTFVLAAGEQARLDVQDTDDDEYDWAANAPDAYPARRRLWWIRSTASDVAAYRVSQSTGGAYSEIAIIPHSDQWTYELITSRRTDGGGYRWKFEALDAAGNASAATYYPAAAYETCRRTPDAPFWTYTYSELTQKVTFSG